MEVNELCLIRLLLKYHFKFIRRFLKFFYKRNIPNVPNEILMLLNGTGVEVGALSQPALLPYASKVFYADIAQSQIIKDSLEKIGYFGYHLSGSFVDVDLLMYKDTAPFRDLQDNSFDFVYSSHSLEHSSNPISSLVEYLRISKPGGIVHTIIPNKHLTYDSKRETTTIDYLIKKFINNVYDYKLEEFYELFNSSSNNAYANFTDVEILSEFQLNSGQHHIYVYDEKNIIELINFVVKHTGSQLVYLNSKDSINIHFTIQKSLD